MQIYLHWQPPPLPTHTLALSFSSPSSPSPYCIVSDWFSEHLRCFPFSFPFCKISRQEGGGYRGWTNNLIFCLQCHRFFSPISGAEVARGRGCWGAGKEEGSSPSSCGQGQGLPPDVPASLGFNVQGAAGGNIGRQKPWFKWSFSLFNMAADTLCVGSSCRA